MFVNPIALETIAWKYYFVYIAFLVAFLLLAFFAYPETRGRTLEQMAFIFDGDAAEVVSSEVNKTDSNTGKAVTVEETTLEEEKTGRSV